VLAIGFSAGGHLIATGCAMIGVPAAAERPSGGEGGGGGGGGGGEGGEREGGGGGGEDGGGVGGGGEKESGDGRADAQALIYPCICNSDGWLDEEESGFWRE